MIVDQQVVSRITDRMMQPTPKVSRSRLTDGIVMQAAAAKAVNAAKVNIILTPACEGRSHAQGARAPELMWQRSQQP
jgi:hypothetical protein